MFMSPVNISPAIALERPTKHRWAQAVNNAVGGFPVLAAASPNEIGDRTGALNRAFKHLCSIRLVGKRLRAWNRTVHYIVKWLLSGGITVAIFWRY